MELPKLYDHVIDGLPVRTGDILCLRNGADGSIYGRIWEGIGKLIPGEIDHCVIYLGPGGRFVEANVYGVTVLEMPGTTWDARALVRQRILLDTLVGVAYPLAGRDLTAAEENRIRTSVADWCLAQSAEDRPFNFNLLDATNPERAYCSQLIAEAYRREGIDLDSNIGVPRASIFRKAVFPEEIWNASEHRRVGDDAPTARPPPSR
ncbi:MAG: hypothetical protein ABI748_14265 [Dokdonella sp.]